MKKNYGLFVGVAIFAAVGFASYEGVEQHNQQVRQFNKQARTELVQEVVAEVAKVCKGAQLSNMCLTTQQLPESKTSMVGGRHLMRAER